VLALAPTANSRLWLVCPDSASITVSTAITEAATLRERHIVYCYNHPIDVDPATQTQVTSEPHGYMAQILSQIEPDVHPGVVETADLTRGIVRLTFEIGQGSGGDADLMDQAGITFLQRDRDNAGNQIWRFRNGLTTDLSTNNRQIDGQRMKYFLIAALAQRMRGDELKPNTPLVRAARKAAFEAYLTELAIGARRFVNVDENDKPLFEVKNGPEVNAPSDVQAGIQRDLVRVQLIPKNLYLQLQVQIGVNVVSFTFQ